MSKNICEWKRWQWNDAGSFRTFRVAYAISTTKAIICQLICGYGHPTFHEKYIVMLRPVFDADRDHFLGDLHAPVELVQYGGYQCSHCGDVLPVLKQLKKALGDDLKLVFRHFPLPNLHPMALEAAVAAEAAGMQGKFWLMHNRIMENQVYLNRSSLNRFAEQIKLDMALFGLHQKNRHLFKKITNDFEGGIHSGVNGTPTFFINGLRYNGFDDFQSLFKVCRFSAGYYKMVI